MGWVYCETERVCETVTEMEGGTVTEMGSGERQ